MATVLLVEDHPLFRKLTARMLEELGHEVVIAEGTAAALDRCARAAPPIDLVVSDVALPGMDGFALARLLLRARPALRVLLMSGYDASTLARDALDGTRGGFIEKPFKLAALRAEIERLLGRPA